MITEILNMKVKRAKHTDCKSARASYRYDFISLMVHERKYHGARYLRGEIYDDRNKEIVRLWESEAYRGQMNHSSWSKTSPAFRTHIERNAGKYNVDP